MKSLPIYSLLGALLMSQSAFALTAAVQEIFDKNNRRLAPPPKSLRADRANMDYRYSNGAERADELKRKNGYGGAVAEAPNDEDYEKLNTPVRAPLSPDSYSESSTSTRRHNRKIVSSFSGERIFGLGFVGGGAYGVFGLESDFTVAPQWSAGVGVGTGMAYTTWSAYGRYYFKESAWNPFFQIGYANWHLQKSSKTGDKISPEFLAGRFFEDKNGNVAEGQRLHLLYPAVGVLYQSPTGFAVSTQLQYFISVNGFTGGLYGDLGFHFYF